MKLSHILLILATTTLALFVPAYRWYEHYLINTLNSTVYEAEISEAKLSNSQESISERNYATVSAFFAQFDEETGEINQLDVTKEESVASSRSDRHYFEEYQSFIHQTKEKLLKLERLGILLYGRNKRYFSTLLSLESEYLDTEYRRTSENFVDNSFVINLIELAYDKAVVADFWNRMPSKNYENFISENFFDLAPVEKYSRKDHVFFDEANIRSSSPYRYEYLDKQRRHLANLYSISKDLYRGDITSAEYKYAKIQSDLAEMNLDWNQVVGENRQESLDAREAQIRNTFERISQARERDYEVSPLFGPTGELPVNLMQCRTYLFRASYFQSLSEKSLDVDSFPALQAALAENNIAGSQFDSQFDSSIMTFKIDGSKIIMTCRDEKSNQTFKSSISQ